MDSKMDSKVNRSTLQNVQKNNNDNECGPNVPNSMFTYKSKLVNVQNLTCSNSLATTNKLKQ
jgi:hypothetical protein